MKHFILMALWLLVQPPVIKAQNENAQNVTGINKGSDILYGGIETSTASYINTDTKDSNGVMLYSSPYLDYNHKSGMGIRVKSYLFAGGSDPGFYLTSLSTYFAKYTGKVLPYISYTRYIQHDNPSAPYSPIQNEAYAHIRLKTKYIDPSMGVDVGFGNDKMNNDKAVSDVNIFMALSHIFVKENIGAVKNHAVAVRPGLQLNAGTDRYYKYLRTSGYISQNTKAKRIGYNQRHGNNNQRNGSTDGSDVYTISEENNFNLSNIEANIYLIYFFGKFSIEPSGSLYFPLRGDDKSPYGFWQLNVNYWFNSGRAAK